MAVRHGEYKVPGGKLVVVDLDVENDRLARVQVTGDFFLEPESALDDICRALEGQPADAGTATLASAIRSALPADAQLFGFSPEAVGIAVRRALGLATTWRDFEWQIVHEPAFSPELHAALDEVLSEEVAAGRRPPTLRLWEWDTTAAVLAAFYKPLNDISSDRGKIGGAAQKRFSNMPADGGKTILHHVTMAYDMDAGKMMQVLRIGREKLSDKGTTSAAKRVDPLRSQTGLPREAIIERMKETFVQLHGGTPGYITPEEMVEAVARVEHKFGTRDWLYRLP